MFLLCLFNIYGFFSSILYKTRNLKQLQADVLRMKINHYIKRCHREMCTIESKIERHTIASPYEHDDENR